jgi:hypothetical protein
MGARHDASSDKDNTVKASPPNLSSDPDAVTVLEPILQLSFDCWVVVF